MSNLAPSPISARPTSPVIACISSSSSACAVAKVAAELARQSARPLILFHTVEDRTSLGHLPDPIASHLDRNRMRTFLVELQHDILLQGAQLAINIAIHDGCWQAELSSIVARNPGADVVVGSSHHTENGHIAGTLVEAGVDHVVFVPDTEAFSATGPVRNRILVPHDGSSFAEAALAQAIGLAAASGAELLLAHAIPASGIEEFGPPVIGDLELRKLIDRRNEDAACEFLEARLRQIRAHGIDVRSRCLKGDPRTRLSRLVAEERPSIVILSARGAGVKTCENLVVGSTATYLLDTLGTPTMLIASAAAPRSGAAWAIHNRQSLQLAREPLNRPPVPAA